MKKIILYLTGIIVSVLIQLLLKIEIERGFIATLLTVFAIFFGFYVTSFAVYSNSKYLSTLYLITDKNDSSKTLLHTLLSELKRIVIFLYSSIIYLVILYILIIYNKTFATYFACILWWVLFMNFYFTYRMADRYIDVVRQSAIRAGKKDND